MKIQIQTRNLKNDSSISAVHGELSTSRAQNPFASVLTLALILSTFGLCSCVGLTSANSGKPGSSAGLLSSSSISVSFGNVTVGKGKMQSVTITNTGSAAVNVSKATISGAGYSIVNGASMTTIAPGATSTVQIQMSVHGPGTSNGRYTLESDAQNSPLDINLTGTGVGSELSISPSSLNFGNVKVGQSATQNVTLSNSGNVDLVVSAAQVMSSGFAISGLTLPATITAGQSTSFTVQFTPTAAQGVTGSIQFMDNASDSPQTFDLAGTGTSANTTLNANPGSIAFGSVAVGNSSSQSITLTNTGASTIAISQAVASGNGFSINGLSPMNLAAGQSTSFAAKFSPASAGSASGTVTITSNATNSTLSIALIGTGTAAQLTASPSSANFGTVSTGNSNSQTITLTNGGSAVVSITQALVTGNGFSLSGMPALPMTINPGASSTFNVVFTPTTSGSTGGSVTLVSNTPNSPLSIALSGTGQTATKLLSTNPASLNFNSVNDGSSTSLNVTLTNNGNSNVTITSATASGTGFSVNGAAGTTLTPNQSVTITVTFAPTSAGAATGSVAIASNASNSPTITLAGTGVQQTSHNVGLTWTASVSTDVVGYNIYRGTASGGPYSILDSAPVAADAYSDSTVQSGQTFYYVVRSVDNTGTESVNSTEVQAIIP
jgi:archaellum component FlaF (FlaF/FlaG flagellin family)